MKQYDAVPGKTAKENIRIENVDMESEGIITQDNKPEKTFVAEFKDRTFYFPKGGKLEVNHSDDFSDSTTQVNILIGYIYKPPDING